MEAASQTHIGVGLFSGMNAEDQGFDLNSTFLVLFVDRLIGFVIILGLGWMKFEVSKSA